MPPVAECRCAAGNLTGVAMQVLRTFYASRSTRRRAYRKQPARTTSAFVMHATIVLIRTAQALGLRDLANARNKAMNILRLSDRGASTGEEIVWREAVGGNITVRKNAWGWKHCPTRGASWTPHAA